MRALKQQQSEWLQGMGILYLAYVRNLYGDIYEHIPWARPIKTKPMQRQRHGEGNVNDGHNTFNRNNGTNGHRCNGNRCTNGNGIRQDS